MSHLICRNIVSDQREVVEQEGQQQQQHEEEKEEEGGGGGVPVEHPLQRRVGRVGGGREDKSGECKKDAIIKES